MKNYSVYKTLIYFFISIMCTIAQNQPCNAQCHIDDWTALKALYENTDGDNWTFNSGWEIIKSDTPPANCDLSNLYGTSGTQRVSSLNLNNNGLNGILPIEIGNLSNLVLLRLKGNQLRGEIPTTISNLVNVMGMELDNNLLTGNIPGELANLSRLQVLTLHDNNLTGCYDSRLDRFCGLFVETISNGNNMDATWELYCEIGEEACSVPKCHIDDWMALKALYESTDGPNWNYNFGWEQLSGKTPPDTCNLGQLQRVYLDATGRVSELHLYNNSLKGTIPTQLASASNLTLLWLSSNNLKGNIPTQLSNLSKLTSLILSHNQLNGNIPSEISNLSNLAILALKENILTGNIPTELANLTNLKKLYLNSNQLTGSVPNELSDLSNLKVFELQDNQLNGTVPDFSSLAEFKLENNHFSCTDLNTNFQLNQQILQNPGIFSWKDPIFTYKPQNYVPENYENIQTHIVDTIMENQGHTLIATIPNVNSIGLSYQWIKNGKLIDGATQPTYNLENILPHNAGQYQLQITDFSCLINDTITFISTPIYIIIKGYDLFGKPVQYNQLMVEFDNAENTALYEQDILLANGGYVVNACNCNRELYLWQFPSTEATAKALLSIDRKLQKLKRKPKPDGGLNNVISFGEHIDTQIAYQVSSNQFNKSFQDAVTIFILDTGLDEQNFNVNPYLINQAPVDNCYEIQNTAGYSYEENTISNNYIDDLGHGTFGFRAITESLNTNNKMKIVPLKIFNKDGEGTLFNMTCAIYHAVDHGADIINISAGYQGEPSSIFERAIQAAQEKDIFITAAAGNDTLNIEKNPYYPAAYAGQYYVFEITDELGNTMLDSLKHKHIISVASINAQGNLSPFSNYGEQSVTLVTYGENIHSKSLQGIDAVASGTSMATFYATKALAIELANDNTRNYEQVWSDFEANWLINNASSQGITQTGKQINFDLITAEIEGCTDPNNCNYFPYATIDDDSCYPAFINHTNIIGEISSFHQAIDSIISNIDVEAFDNLNYIAGDLIQLEIGFNIEKGATFLADIELCD